MKRQIAFWMGHLPSNAMSRAVGWFSGIEHPRCLARFNCKVAPKLLHINLDEAVIPDGGYKSVNDLFTRHLKEGARPIAGPENSIVSPVDATWGMCGQLDGLKAIQAKGVTYTVDRFVGDPDLGNLFRDGTFATFYLCPADYHRVHSPLAGTVTRAIHIPGGLLPVFKESTELHQDLFVRNERLVTLLDTPVGKVAVVKVGATSVGKITVAYDETLVTNRGTSAIVTKDYNPGFPVDKGGELGVFNLGSTVVLLFEKGRVNLDIKPAGTPVKMGELVGTCAL